MVPQFEDFLYPTLLSFGNGDERSVVDARKFNIKYLHLTEQDADELIKSGNRTKVHDRTSFSVTYLFQAGLITRTKRGFYVISDLGKDLLNKGIKLLTREYLEANYTSFYEFSRIRKKTNKNNVSSSLTTKSEGELTPQEQMENAFDIIHDDLADKLIDEVKRKSPRFFENLVIKLLVAMGYGGSEKEALVTKYSHDDGVDGIIKEDKLGLDSIYVQAKRYTAGAVQKPDMQKFIGALSEQGATKGIFITTSTFSTGARETINKTNHIKIVLIDGQQLAKYMIQYGIGVSIMQVYEIKKIDTDFFSDEE